MRKIHLALLASTALCLGAACGGDDGGAASNAAEVDGEATSTSSGDAAEADGPETCSLLTEAEVDEVLSSAGLDLDVGACTEGSSPEEAYWPADHGLGVRLTREERATEADALAAYEANDAFEGATTKQAAGFRHSQLGRGVGGTSIVSVRVSAFTDAQEAGASKQTRAAELELLTLVFKRLG